jgi:hypothetical protein
VVEAAAAAAAAQKLGWPDMLARSLLYVQEKKASTAQCAEQFTFAAPKNMNTEQAGREAGR